MKFIKGLLHLLTVPSTMLEWPKNDTGRINQEPGRRNSLFHGFQLWLLLLDRLLTLSLGKYCPVI